MPLNSANKTFKEIGSGQAFEFYFKNLRSTPATMTLKNLGSTDFTVQLQSAPAGRDEIQTVTITGTSTSGTFTLTFSNGVTTATTTAITYSATAATLQTNIRATIAAIETALGLTSGSIQVGVTAAAANSATIRIAFRPVAVQAGYSSVQGKDLSYRNVTAVTCSVAGLSGGTPAAAIAETQQGLRPGDSTLYADSDPDGYNDAITVKAGGILAVAYGAGADENNARNAIGPYVKISCTAGRGQLELGIADDDIHELRT